VNARLSFALALLRFSCKSRRYPCNFSVEFVSSPPADVAVVIEVDGCCLRWLAFDAVHHGKGVGKEPLAAASTNTSAILSALVISSFEPPPEVLEPMRRKVGVAHRVLDVLVPEPSLQRPGVVTGVG
jgi:hypothetical protein